MINDLAKSTKFDTQDVKKLLDEFNQLANGKNFLRKDQANAIKSILESSRLCGDDRKVASHLESEDIVLRLFDAFDTDNSGTIDFKQFVVGLNRTSRGGKRKIELAFRYTMSTGVGEYIRTNLLNI